MNKIFIIGNLTKDPELRTTASGINVCSFTVAVNRRNRSENSNQPEADYFRVNAWRGLAEICSKYLAKGRKVSVTGPVSASAYMGNDNTPRASIDINADDIEFLSPKGDTEEVHNPSSTSTTGYNPSNVQAMPAQQAPVAQNTYVQVDDDDLPF